MKYLSKYIVSMVVLLTLASSSCETDSGIGNSITGAWRCREEGATSGFRQYSVNIDRTNTDTTLFIIYNFYNLGFDLETYASLKDSIVTLLYTNENYNVSGKGHVSKDLKAIEWEYSISGFNVNDNYVQALYYRN